MSEALEIAQALLTAIGAASALAAALKPLVGALSRLAERTAWSFDDRAMQAVAAALEAFAVGIAYAYKGLSFLGLNPAHGRNAVDKELP